MELLFILLVFILVAVLAVWLYIARQGDAEFEFLVDQRTEFTLDESTRDSAVFSCRVPFVNKGTQDGTIMDCYTRHLLPEEQYDEVETFSRLELETHPRKDGYFEAAIIPKTTGNAVVVTVKFVAKDGDIGKAMVDMVDFGIDIVYQVVARGKWYITKERMTVTAEELNTAIRAGA